MFELHPLATKGGAVGRKGDSIASTRLTNMRRGRWLA